MDKKPNEIRKNFILMKLTTVPYNTKSYKTIKHKYSYLIDNWPAFLTVNNGYICY